MKEEYGNILAMNCDAFCITTNGYVKNNGALVMGRGIAKQIQRFVPNIPYILGNLVKTQGNKVHLVLSEPNRPSIISFPVKPISKICRSPDDYVSHMKYQLGDLIAGWACKADIEIIIESAEQLVELANQHPEWKRILIPRAGCGAGELDWKDVKPILEEILDDRFIAVTFKPD